MEEQTDKKEESNPAKLRMPKEKRELIDQLKKVPIVQIACERIGISRPTFYRWKKDDEDFTKAVKEALSEGVIFINELSESQVITLIKEKDLSAVRFWLRHNHPKYAQRIEITTKELQEELNPEQEAVVKEALRLSSMRLVEVKVEEKIIEPIVVQERPTVENKPEEQKGPRRMTEEEFSQLEGEITEPIIVDTKRGETTHAPHGEKLTRFKSGGSAYSPPNSGYEPLLKPSIKKVEK